MEIHVSFILVTVDLYSLSLPPSLFSFLLFPSTEDAFR